MVRFELKMLCFLVWSTSEKSDDALKAPARALLPTGILGFIAPAAAKEAPAFGLSQTPAPSSLQGSRHRSRKPDPTHHIDNRPQTMADMQYYLRVAGFAVILSFVAGQSLPADAAHIGAGPFALIAKDLRDFRKYCPDESIWAETKPAPFGHGIEATVIRLKSSRGACFGQMSENDYIAVKLGGGWQIVLSGMPGIIEVHAASGGRGPQIQGAWVGCTASYTWTGHSFSRKAEGCDGHGVPASLAPLVAALRANE